MAPDTQSMTGRGRREKVTDSQIIELLRNDDRPGWSATALAENFDVTRQTAHTRLKDLVEEVEDIRKMEVGTALLYYSTFDTGGYAPSPENPAEERNKQKLVHYLDGQFVGSLDAPWTPTPFQTDPAKAGDHIQFLIEMHSDSVEIRESYTEENRLNELPNRKKVEDSVQALAFGELYEKPTTPIEHMSYADDYDLEALAEREPQLFSPCNGAVFLTGVRIDDLSPEGEGPERPGLNLMEDAANEAARHVEREEAPLPTLETSTDNDE